MAYAADFFAAAVDVLSESHRPENLRRIPAGGLGRTHTRFVSLDLCMTPEARLSANGGAGASSDFSHLGQQLPIFT